MGFLADVFKLLGKLLVALVCAIALFIGGIMSLSFGGCVGLLLYGIFLILLVKTYDK